MVKKYPLLYDPSHCDFRNMKKRDIAWNEIATKAKDNCENVKKRWKNLRDSFLKHLKQKETKTGLSEKHRKRWMWADVMDFYRPFLLTTDKKSYEGFECNGDVDGNLKVEDATESDDSSSPSISDSAVSEPPSLLPVAYPKKRKRKPTSKPSVEALLHRYEKNVDAIDLLFLAHSQTVKTFSGKRQALTKMKIAEVIMQQEIQHLDELSPQQIDCNKNTSST